MDNLNSEEILFFLEEQTRLLEKMNGSEGLRWRDGYKKFMSGEFFEEEVRRTKPPKIPSSKRTLSTWKRIQLGGMKDLTTLITKIRGLKGRRIFSNHISDDAIEMMNHPRFVISQGRPYIDLVVIPAYDLGWSDPFDKRHQLDSQEFCLDWSQKNLSGYAINFCEPEDAAYLRDQYVDQPNLEILWMGMKPITNSRGKVSVFRVRCGNEVKILETEEVSSPDFKFKPDSKIVFELIKLK